MILEFQPWDPCIHPGEWSWELSERKSHQENTGPQCCMTESGCVLQGGAFLIFSPESGMVSSPS